MNIFWIILGIIPAYIVIQAAWIALQLIPADARKTLFVPQNRLGGRGVTRSKTCDSADYTITHTIENGIERIAYLPKQRRYTTPILMIHGMWHGAWCWETWQSILAEQGWESVAFSLPGHGDSPVQRPVYRCTLDYYLAFVRDEVERLPRPPVLMGHSMGGALAQWALKYLGQEKIAAAILVAPWVSHNALADGFPLFIGLDPIGCLLMSLQWSATPFIRTPEHAARALISEKALYAPDELHSRLGPESALVMMQHNPPFWSPAQNVSIPMLVLAGKKDAVVSLKGLQRTAEHYHADFMIIDAAHNLMMEHNYRETAQSINQWLAAKNIP
jgi:pimeloyl-ACP methyl ester carboxylesterase